VSSPRRLVTLVKAWRLAEDSPPYLFYRFGRSAKQEQNSHYAARNEVAGADGNCPCNPLCNLFILSTAWQAEPSSGGSSLMARFPSREQAGRQLTAQLSKFQSDSPVVLAIPNGGIPVALPVAQSLNTSLSLVPIRSLQVPWDEQTIFGYVTNTGAMHLNHALIGQTRLTPPEIYQISNKRRLSLRADLESWGVAVPKTLQEKTVVIVDDGMHSGWTMFSAIETAKLLEARKVIAAIPVTHFRARRFVGHHCSEVVSLLTEDIALFQIENYYDEFPEISNEEAGLLLKDTPKDPHRTAA
jgi:putative phosphoribosyl transferase